jgi:CRP/FNR family transcriptional regulator, cyclic AMP receptor protein
VRSWDVVGYMASALVIVTFSMKNMVPLRPVAPTSNVAFFVYGMELGVILVWALHTVLFPINAWRLCQAIRLEWRTSILETKHDTRASAF